MSMYIKDTLKASISGNAGTATKLATARAFTIGNTGKSFDGSGNVSWSTSEILGQGAANKSDTNTLSTLGVYEIQEFGSNGPSGAYQWGGLLTLRHGNVTNQVYLSHNNNEMWIRGGWNGTWNSSWSRVYTTTYKPTAADVGAAASGHTHSYLPLSGGSLTGSLTVGGALIVNTAAYNGTTAYTSTPIGLSYKAVGDTANGAMSTYSTIFTVKESDNRQFQLNVDNGGSVIAFRSAHVNNTGGTGTGWTAWKKIYHEGNKPTPADIGAAASSHGTHLTIGTGSGNAAAGNHTHNYAGSSSAGGAANSATVLATARTINGTSFNGSANITTANWGTARTLTIGATGKSVNGSGNVSWSLQEIMKGQGLNAGTAMNTLYFNNAGVDHVGRLSTYRNTTSNLDYVQVGLYNVANSGTVNTLNVYPSHSYTANEFWCASNIRVNGKKLHITASAPSSPSTGDIWIDI